MASSSSNPSNSLSSPSTTISSSSPSPSPSPSVSVSADYTHPESHPIPNFHAHEISENQTSSLLTKRIRAPIDVVWSIIRRFDEPQIFKPFVQGCRMQGDGIVKEGCIREVYVVSGLPATTSIERLDILDDENHLLIYTILGGDHRLKNYRSVMSLQEEIMDEKPGTLVMKSYVVDIPDGNTKEDTQLFVEALLKCNLKSLADLCERLAAAKDKHNS